MEDRDRERYSPRGGERDLVLSPTEQAMILDETKGSIVVWVGPANTSLSATQKPVVFNGKTGRFEQCDLSRAIEVLPTAPEGYYIVLLNPSGKKEPEYQHPKKGVSSSTEDLNIGMKVNIPGPTSFPLWPGQVATILRGHRLRSNQYLIVQVYNDEAAKEHWGTGVIKPQIEGDTPRDVEPKVNAGTITMGQQLVIKGTNVSFYIPPTGLKVVADNRGEFVRDAVTLERLEYCILLGENGNKRFVPGPNVVFPEPTEQFVETSGARKFRAVELNENMGIYVKVIEDYTEGEDEFKAGQELFITGKEQQIYFPRKEHAIIKYGDLEMHYAAAIPVGEARYVLNKTSGNVDLTTGPQMFLPDPRNQVVIKRILDARTVKLWYPNNQEVAEHNQGLRQAAADYTDGEFLADADYRTRSKGAKSLADVNILSAQAGDEFSRKQRYTPPRSISLETKYDGAVAVGPWTGYAVQVVSKTGARKVIVGPQNILLEYDESLEILAMSTGTPKTDDSPIRTVYLLVQNNKVSDRVNAETRDLVEVDVKVSYRVNFIGEETKWFAVENYVKLMTDHCRSLIRNAVKQNGIEDFNNNAIAIIRDTILGAQNEDGKRSGRTFDENGMHIYDVEILEVEIGDDTISDILHEAQHEAVKQAVDLVTREHTLEATKKTEVMDREIAELQNTTALKKIELELLEMLELAKRDVGRVEQEFAETNARNDQQMAQAGTLEALANGKITRDKLQSDYEHAVDEARADLDRKQMEAVTVAIAARAVSVSPQLIATLESFSNRELLGKLAPAMSPLAIIGGKSLVEAATDLVKGTALSKVFENGKALLTNPDTDKVL